MKLNKLQQGARWVSSTRSLNAFVIITLVSLDLPLSKTGMTTQSVYKQATRWVKYFQEVLNHSEPDKR